MSDLKYQQRVLGLNDSGRVENSIVKRARMTAISGWVTILGRFHPGNQKQIRKGGGSGVDEEKTRWREKEVVGEEESSWKKIWCEGKRLWRERRRRGEGRTTPATARRRRDPTSSSSFQPLCPP
ncbi:hypothetical protein QVD17_15762 [Tagetes erecta]|uniref:Uncharacterized protein n=1 Tax=Tagetes erecta TaxID=13708 RepID=A0AAD8KPS5_TARER|nr:hypothetical protein QVD17_15762 [Tagetes erecta]